VTSAVRLRLTLFYAGLLALASGLVLLASYVLVRNHLNNTLDAETAHVAVASLGSQYLIAVAGVVLLAAGGGWLVSGEVLAPLTRAIASQRRFVANASHELRTPMTAIRTGAEVALDDPDATVGDLRAVLRDTVAATEETDRLMTSLLALASATDGTRADAPVEWSDIVRTVLPPGARIDARLQPTTVRGDAALLQRAAANLVDNAMRHGRPGGRVVVQLHDGELTVANAGAPIAPEDLQRLTEPFERLRRGTAPGTGLGLSIVKAIAESHGGRLALEAPAEGGLVARLALPVATR
jgi:signal transduction histidine kinase